MLKKLVTLVAIDILILCGLFILVRITDMSPMVFVYLFLLTIILILFSGLIGLLLYWQKSRWGDPLMINMVICLVLLFGSMQLGSQLSKLGGKQHSSYTNEDAIDTSADQRELPVR